MQFSKFTKIVVETGTEKPNEHDRVILVGSLYINQNPIFVDKELIFDLGFSEDFDVLRVMNDIVSTMGLNEKCQIVLLDEQCLSEYEKSALGVTNFNEQKIQISLYLTDIQKVYGSLILIYNFKACRYLAVV